MRKFRFFKKVIFFFPFTSYATSSAVKGLLTVPETAVRIPTSEIGRKRFLFAPPLLIAIRDNDSAIVLRLIFREMFSKFIARNSGRREELLLWVLL